MTDQLSPEQIAFNAHQSFRKLIPQFESFVRVALGKNVPVIAGDRSSTDGERIIIKPPYELGFNFEHNRNLCDRLDYTGFQRCPACGVRENLIFQVYHEISHLVYGTFEGTYAEAARILRSHGVPNVRRASKQTRDWTIYHSAFETSQYLGVILNAIEDVRVDSKMFFSKPGLRRMMQVNIQSIMDSGIKDYDGSAVRWNQLPIDVQVIMFFYMTGRRQGFRTDVFAPEVIALESDQTLLELLAGIETLGSVAESLDRAIRLWQHGKSLGFFLEEGTDEPPQPEEEDEEQAEQQDKSDKKGHGELEQSSSGSDKPGDSSESGESGDDSESDDSGSSGNNDPSSSSEGDEESSSSEDLEDDPESDSGEANEAGVSSESESGDNDSPGDENSDQDGNSGTDDDGGSEPGDSAGADQGESDSDARDSSEGDGSGESDSSEDDSSDTSDGTSDAGTNDAESDDSGTSTGDQTREGNGGDSQSDVDDSDGDYDDYDSDEGTGDLPSSNNGTIDGAGSETVPPSNRPPARREQATSDQEWADNDIASEPPPSIEATEQGQLKREATPQELWEMYREKHGTTDQVIEMMEQLFGHAEVAHKDETPEWDQSPEDAAMRKATKQSIDFDEASRAISGVVKLSSPNSSWGEAFTHFTPEEEERLAREVDKYELSGVELSMPAVKLRKVFSENKRNKYTKNMRRGRINSASLGRRAPVNDDRVFQRKLVNEERDYSVVIVGDISGSTAAAERLQQVKACMKAQGDLLQKIGVPFQMLAHSGYDIAAMHGRSRWSFAGHKSPAELGDREQWGDEGEVVVIATVKDWKEPWGATQIDRLKHLPSTGYNLDGHVFEYCRKQLQSRPESERLLMYYSDGQMPAQNYNEELNILQRELQLMEKLGIAVAAVGIQDNGPAQYGIPMIQYQEKADIHKVVDHIAKQLGAV